jgi:hypothetical protein
MDVNSVFGGDSLKAADLNGRDVTVTIASVEEKVFNDGAKGPQKKLLIRFAGAKKALICNKTNAKRIALLHGPETDRWPGKAVTLYADMVDFQGDAVMAIRVKGVAAFTVPGFTVPQTIQPVPAAPIHYNDPMPDQTRQADPADDIPF